MLYLFYSKEEKPCLNTGRNLPRNAFAAYAGAILMHLGSFPRIIDPQEPQKCLSKGVFIRGPGLQKRPSAGELSRTSKELCLLLSSEGLSSSPIS